MSDTNMNLERCKVVINNCDPIDANDPAYEQIFRDLQGGVIKNYGRNYSLYIFIQFYENKQEEIKKWIRDDIACSVTSTWRQLKDTKTFKRIRERDSSFSGKLCKNFFLSYQGYKRLGLNPENPNESEAKINDSLFIRGMKKDWETSYRLDHASTDYWYNPPESWDIGKDQIDALILLAHDNLEDLKKEAKNLLIEFDLEEIGQVAACEAGYALRDDNNKTIGPFGFADGISQPLFLKSDYDKYCQNHNIDLWDPKASLELVLVKDPFGAEYSYGSYCVFKKLETNLELFENKVNELTKILEGNDREIAGALVMGRFKDGTPIALSGKKPDQSNQNDKNLQSDNNFNYADDFSGGKCPLQAHIRKVNPRKDDSSEENSRRTTNRIFRAGITYFEPPAEPQGLNMLQRCLNNLDYLEYITEVSKQSLADNNISGLLFVCFQKSISQQFSLLQQQWADDSKFPRERDEGKYKYVDPIIGHPAKRTRREYPDPQEWPQEWNGKKFSPHPFYGCVKERGGEFLFAPSISFLKNL